MSSFIVIKDNKTLSTIKFSENYLFWENVGEVQSHLSFQQLDHGYCESNGDFQVIHIVGLTNTMMLQYAISYYLMQWYAKICFVMRYDTMLCELMQYDVIESNEM